MDFSDFPNYFQAASNVAVKYQRYYNAIKRSAVVLLILSVVVTLYSFQRSEDFVIVNIVIAVLLLISFILAVLLLTRKYDQLAQESLNLKESCKTATWQFIMAVGEFNLTASVADLQEVFEIRMQQIVEQYKELIPHLDQGSIKQHKLSSKMFELRDASFEKKKHYYSEQRIDSLYDHYVDKAYEYHQKYKLWSLNLMMSQVFAIGATGFLLFGVSVEWSVIALVTMLVSSIVSWFELQNNLEKEQHYSLVAKELYGIREALGHISLESELAEFVWDAEKVISGPNAFWLIPGSSKDREEVLI